MLTFDHKSRVSIKPILKMKNEEIPYLFFIYIQYLYSALFIN